jgi:hypothetical protein
MYSVLYFTDPLTSRSGLAEMGMIPEQSSEIPACRVVGVITATFNRHGSVDFNLRYTSPSRPSTTKTRPESTRLGHDAGAHGSIGRGRVKRSPARQRPHPAAKSVPATEEHRRRAHQPRRETSRRRAPHPPGRDGDPRTVTCPPIPSQLINQSGLQHL